MAESPTMEVRARLTADSAQFTKGLSEATKSAENFQGAATKLNSALVGLGAVSAGLGVSLVLFATRSFKAAAEVQELDIALQAIGKSSRYGYTQLAEVVDQIKEVGITSAAAQRAVIKLAQSNVDLGDAQKLATVAQNLSVTASVNAADALQSLIFAITTGQTRMLRQIGITAGATEAYAIYARTIGKSANELNMAERRQAVLNLVLKEGTKVTGAYALAMQSPSKALKEMSDLTNNLQVAVGKRLLDAFSKIILASFALYTKFTLAANGTGTFSKFLDAMEKVLTKLADPFAKIATNLGNFIEKLDASKMSVNGIASVMEKLLPIAVGFTTFFGIKAGKSLSQAAPFFQGFFKALDGYKTIFTLFAVALTSPQIRGALGQLISAFAPLLPILKSLGAILAEVSALGLGILAKAIRLVASAISSSIAFIQKYSTAFKVLGGALVAIGAALLVYKARLIAIAIAQKLFVAYSAFMTLVMVQGASAMAAFNAVLAANPILRVVMLISALVTAIVILYKNSETFREGFTLVFNSVASVVGKVVAFVIRALAYLLLAFGNLIDINNTFGKVVATVIQFVYDAYINAFLGIAKGIKFVLDAFISLMENNDTFRKVVIDVFNAVLRIIALAVTQIVVSFANILKAIASGIYIFEKFLDISKTIVKGVIAAFAFLGKGIFNIFKTLGSGVGNFLNSALDTIKGWVMNVVGLLMKVPGVGKLLESVFASLSNLGNSAVNTLKNIGSTLSDALFGDTENGSKRSIDAISSVSTTLIKSAKSWGNYSEGAAGAISGIANKMLDFNMKLVDFAKQDNGSKVVSGLIKGATFASEGFGKVIGQLEKIQGFKIGEFIVKNTSEAAVKASDYLFGLALSIESFTQGNVLGKLGGVFGDIADAFKTGLGFGDVLAEEKKKADDLSKVNASNDTAADELQNSADVMKKIREAMADGIQSMKDVLGDLQQAAKDFADSLKDTILGFAGLKGVELPDGFIPRAKSLIENMRMRLDKSQKFAQQIGTLQGLGLDTKALQDIIESGPLKGAQLAASIIGGGVDAVNQINELQKKISFTGAAIGAFGADAAFSGQIASAQLGIAQVTDAEAKVRGLGGNNIVIEQGAFVVNVDTTGATTQDEKADIITRRIQETFAILAKELANK
jgi:hypothetical protein